MIRRWNEVVTPKDQVYHLGDFALAAKPVIAELVATLNGYKFLIRGNHDRSVKAMKECGFSEVWKYHILEPPVVPIVVAMSHHPRAITVPGGTISLCGHSHEKMKMKEGVLNVGVDVWDFRPVSLQQVMKEFLT